MPQKFPRTVRIPCTSSQLSPDDERYVDHSRLRVIYQPFRGERLREEARALATRAALSALGAISRG